ncbi:hypothetical protein SAMN06297251_112120 [Fulvimarina manganoxydans]|uniref:Lipoprotein n=2 Tax=Fulvimarina manganoxydans TaxID=937218 RepID=A0A1W2D5B9_9HYPH|nr:hypothetical protein SAMN06297251_112120 [Fulvimarina manganoxydans]
MVGSPKKEWPMRKIVLSLLTAAAVSLSGCVVPDSSSTQIDVGASRAKSNEIFRKGRRNRGISAYAYLYDIGGAGTRVKLRFQCVKNWGGQTKGNAYIAIVETTAQRTNRIVTEWETRCRARGRGDGKRLYDRREAKYDFRIPIGDFRRRFSIVVIANYSETSNFDRIQDIVDDAARSAIVDARKLKEEVQKVGGELIAVVLLG